jgi:ABC-type sugar transport system ATPase subunit
VSQASGKTTTLKIANRLLEPDAGEVLIDGQPTRTQPPHLLRRRIGYVFQRIGLFPHLTVAENIGITPQLLEWPREKIARARRGAPRARQSSARVRRALSFGVVRRTASARRRGTRARRETRNHADG